VSAFDQITAGLYLQDQIELPYRFFLMAGARYQYIRQTGQAGETLATLPPPGRPQLGQAVTPRFGLLWRPQDWVSFYGNYTESFGLSSGLVFPGVPGEPTSAQSWEAGVKFDLLGGRLRATADYFDLTKTNIPTADLVHPGFSTFTAEARSKGVEVDAQGELLPGWDVRASYPTLDARITSGTGGLLGLQAEGQRIAGVPQNLASPWTVYAFQDESLKGLKIGGGYTYHGSQLFIELNPDFDAVEHLLPSYGTVDLMGAYSFNFAGTKSTAQVNISNLFNQFYTRDAIILPATTTSGFGWGQRSYGAPFSVLGSIRAEF